MKRTLFIAILSTFFVGAVAQNKITGIGKLKLNISSSIIKDIGYKNEPIQVLTDRDFFSKVYKKYSGYDSYILLPDTTLKSYIKDVPFDNRVIVYYLPSYSPVEGIELKGVTLKFINDSLYYIHINYSRKLSEAFNLKYGNAEIDLKENEKTYVNGLGVETTKTDQMFTSTWQTGDDDISCYEVIYKYHNNKGKADYITYHCCPLKDKNKQITYLKRLYKGESDL
jgi:hypothetical protein